MPGIQASHRRISNRRAILLQGCKNRVADTERCSLDQLLHRSARMIGALVCPVGGAVLIMDPCKWEIGKELAAPRAFSARLRPHFSSLSRIDSPYPQARHDRTIGYAGPGFPLL